MKGHYLVGSHGAFFEHNIYANKSSVVLDWLLRVGIAKKTFSIREVARDRNVSVGLVQRVFEVLVVNGILQVIGIRTAKKFKLKKPEVLLTNWLEHYSIVKKCKMWTYYTAFEGRKQVIDALEQSHLHKKVALALHSAADVYGVSNTNLQTVELYLLEPEIKLQVEEVLQLEPQERGYEVLLINPYYKSILNIDKNTSSNKHVPCSPALLTFLDLYHFPLRGREQAEFMAERINILKRIYKKG